MGLDYVTRDIEGFVSRGMLWWINVRSTDTEESFSPSKMRFCFHSFTRATGLEVFLEQNSAVLSRFGSKTVQRERQEAPCVEKVQLGS